MVRRIDLMAINFYLKEPLTGSLDGMRYRIKRTEDEETKDIEDEKLKKYHLQVVLYPDAKCFEKTDEELKQYYDFPYTEEGLLQITDFLNQQSVEQKELWHV